MAQIKSQEMVLVDELIPYVNNAKVHSEAQVTKIASSIREFGFLNPVLIDKDKNVIAGHGRILAAKKLNMTEVPCVYIEGLTEAQRKAYILADNRLGELADWDMSLVNSELDILKEANFDIELTGFDLPDDFQNEPEDESEGEFDDIEKLEAHYGVPYQGNKSRIADIIINILPEGKRLVDLFGGGGDNTLRNAIRKVGKLPLQRY